MIDFPDSPTLNQVFQGPNGISYTWNGTLWLVQNTFAGGTGDFSAMGTGIGLSAGVWTTLGNTTVVNGNAGGWFSTSSNGRYTPPAGRYHLSASFFSVNSTSPTTLQLKFRKNGSDIGSVAVSSSPGANYYAEVFNDITVDANGSDWFDTQANSSLSATPGGSSFSAFPLTGMQGPAGPPPLGSLSLYSEQVLVAPSAQLAVTFPAAAKLVELVWDVAMTPASDILMALQGMVGATPNASAGYSLNRLHSTGTSGATAVTGDLNVTLTAFNMQAPSLFRGKATFMTPSKALGVGQVYGVSTAGVRTFTQIGFEAQGITGLDGYRLFCASNNFAAGSFLRCLVVV